MTMRELEADAGWLAIALWLVALPIIAGAWLAVQVLLC
jgi:hypothetical protein